MFLFSCHLRKNSLRSRERVSHWAFVAGSSSVALSLPSFLHVFGSCFNQPPLDELVLRSVAWQVIEWCSHNPSCTTETWATWSFAELCTKIFWGIVSESSTSRYKLQSLRSTLQACFLICFYCYRFDFVSFGKSGSCCEMCMWGRLVPFTAPLLCAAHTFLSSLTAVRCFVFSLPTKTFLGYAFLDTLLLNVSIHILWHCRLVVLHTAWNFLAWPYMCPWCTYTLLEHAQAMQTRERFQGLSDYWFINVVSQYKFGNTAQGSLLPVVVKILNSGWETDCCRYVHASGATLVLICQKVLKIWSCACIVLTTDDFRNYYIILHLLA